MLDLNVNCSLYILTFQNNDSSLVSVALFKDVFM